jgi:hypothetical protein
MKITSSASAAALPLAAVIACGGAFAAPPPATEGAASAEKCRHFLPDSRPMTRWWWFASMIREEDIDAQLEWLKAKGFGGVEIAWMYPLNIERYTRFYPWISEEERKTRTPRQEWLSPEWSQIVAYAKSSASRLGLQCDFTFGMAWPFGDGGVPAEDATQVFGNPEFKQLNLIPWEYPTQGHIIDHMSKPAFERYAGRLAAALADGLKGPRSGLFCDSWEVETDRIWTDGFGEAFKARFGYEIEPFMEKIFTGDDKDARHDYMLLVSEHVLKNFYQPFTAKSHELGAFSRVQCHGSPTDLIDAYAAVDVPETEALLYEPNFGRIAASAAALAGHGDVSCETFTCIYGFPRERIRQEQTADLKLLADSLFANGVNHVVWHGKPFNRKGSDKVEFYASVHVGPDSALVEEMPAFNGYMEKVSTAMKRGRTYSGVAQYLPLEDAWMAGLYPEEKRLKWSWGAYELRYEKHAPELRGHHPLWINHRFLKEARFENGLLHAGALTFSSLLVDAEHLGDEVLATILDLARQGLPVCMKRRPLQAGKNKCDSFNTNLDALLALPNVSDSFAKTAVRPPLVEGDDLPDYWCRVENGNHIIFFAHPLARNLKHPMAYGQSLTTETLSIPVRIHAGNANIETTLVFPPHQSLLLEIDADGQLRQHDISFQPKTPKRGD